MTDFVIDPSKHFGWAGPKKAQEAWDQIGHLFPKFIIVGDGPDDSVGKRAALYETVRRGLGHDTLNFAQETGDCFVDGTMVTLGDSTLCPIEDIGVGETVISGSGYVREVVSTFQKMYTGDILRIQSDGQEPSPPCTADHQFQTMEGRWVKAAELRVGDVLRTAVNACISEFGPSKITGIKHTAVKNIPVRCLEVEADHSFIAGGYVVHNCVSFGAKNAIEYLQGIAIALGKSDGFHPIFPPYLYNTGRVLIGQNQLRGQQGSVGSWQAKAAEVWGSLPSDSDGCPAYSGDLANQWGDNRIDDKFYTAGKLHLVQTTAPINSWDDLRRAINNGYPCTIASNQGFEMKARSDGFHYPSGQWGHQMLCALIDDDPKDPYIGILNSWGDVHGQIGDFKTGENWPKGMLRVRRRTIEYMIQSGECIAYSNWVGFPAQKINWSLAI